MNDNREYTKKLKLRVESVFEFASRIGRMQQLLEEIREKVEELPVQSEQEKRGDQEAISAFDKRMQRMVCATFDNIERYQVYKWQELFGMEDEADG